MPKICYEEKQFGEVALRVIALANAILIDYAKQGYDLTLRQLYYRMVAAKLFPDDRRWVRMSTGRWVRDPSGTMNAQPNYKWLGDIMADARLAGLVDWDYLVDRTRNLRTNQHWGHPREVVSAAADAFALDKWESQSTRVEVWVEKDAMSGIVGKVCTGLDVPWFSCRGYTSLSEMWGASQRLLGYLAEGKEVVILHLGDHDPSGLDMSGNIFRRLTQFTGQKIKVRRVALNRAQIDRYNPPPDPAKTSDSRYEWYVQEYGTEDSWELDALDPVVITRIIEQNVAIFRDDEIWEGVVSDESEAKDQLHLVSEQWDHVVKILEQRGRDVRN